MPAANCLKQLPAFISNLSNSTSNQLWKLIPQRLW
jgi:hypothetical protein